MNRTTDVSGFIKKNISRISERVNSTYAFLQAPPIFGKATDMYKGIIDP